jgi:predicted O-methyltransferase YrrM
MQIINSAIEKYADHMSTPVDAILYELEKETYQKVLQPNMLSGSYQGQLLSIISKVKKPDAILEIGTYTGYSTICLAQGLKKNGVIHTLEINEELKSIQDKYFKKCNLDKFIYQHLGNAKETLPKLDKRFDLLFIDADKKNYRNYIDATYHLLNPGALVLTDNVLWKGKVVEPDQTDKMAHYIHQFNQYLADHKGFSTVLLPVRDGLSLSIKN